MLTIRRLRADDHARNTVGISRFTPRFSIKVLTVAVLAMVLGATTLALKLGHDQGDAGSCPGKWVAAWGASAKAVWVPGTDHGPLDGRTMRLIARVQTDGDAVRIRLSNRYGFDPLEIGAASVAVAQQGPNPASASAAIAGGRPEPVTFDRQPRTTVPANTDIVSDPVPLTVVGGAPVAVSLYLPRASVMMSEHENALQTSYLSAPGDHTDDGSGDAFTTPLMSWPVLTGIEVHAARPTNSVLVLGDSITDGVGTDPDRDQRWPDALLLHLTPPGRSPDTTVINGGIAGNELLADAPDRTGDSPAQRLSWELPLGATDVILEIGNNDIKQGRSAQAIIDGLTQFAGAARARGVRVFLTTVTPANPGSDYGTSEATAIRRAVNDWVRSHGRDVADGVIDLAEAVSSPNLPDRINPSFNADGIHLSAAGSEALARAVDPVSLTRPSCP